ncbi:hypothetical protein AVM02_02015 [Brucella anthropi]
MQAHWHNLSISIGGYTILGRLTIHVLVWGKILSFRSETEGGVVPPNPLARFRDARMEVFAISHAGEAPERLKNSPFEVGLTPIREGFWPDCRNLFGDGIG